MAFYRHFCERDDFEIMVITDNPLVLKYNVPYRFFLISRGSLWQRVTTSRLHKVGHTLGHFFSTDIRSPEIVSAITDFAPQAIFTVAGSWSWMALLAKRTAKKLGLPLIGSFNDWWFYNVIRLHAFDKLLAAQFRKFYLQCDLAICTSPGMMNELGGHRNAVVIYPTGARREAGDQLETYDSSESHFTLTFAGNLGEWYGSMLQKVITENPSKDIQFRIYGSNAMWARDFDQMVRTQKIYLGHVSFSCLKQSVRSSNALLLLMGFDESIALVEKTSFKTKFLDYISFGKPILLWGPEYCSAVKVARAFDSAEVCTSENVTDLMAVIRNLKNDPERQRSLVNNAISMYEHEFHPDKIHSILKKSIEDVIKNYAFC